MYDSIYKRIYWGWRQIFTHHLILQDRLAAFPNLCQKGNNFIEWSSDPYIGILTKVIDILLIWGFIWLLMNFLVTVQQIQNTDHS